MANARMGIREALTGSTNVKEKGPPVADGVLSVTPDTPEIAEWRSRQALDCVASSSSYLEDEDDGKKPHELFGKFTWKIENFSEISKRELRSNQFECGEYKWYILVYPQGCDVCNHLSLFLCVADYDKLLPGWSHFAQFTIAVVNKDPKKSKYSDTLHRFCKKEHDWGWKKFMELSKVLDGFTVADTLVIKAQVQVILDKPGRPFRCLDPQYRRELVRVYLTNVESICRRFCEEKRLRLAWVAEEGHVFRSWWGALTPERQRKLLTERGETILKGVVKQFFNEKEVTSTLVMDALYSGCRQIEEYSRQYAEGIAIEGPPLVIIRADRNNICLASNVAEVAERASKDFIPPYSRDDKALIQGADGLALRSHQEGDSEFRRDSVERDERRLGELGKKTVEMFAITHIFTEKLEVAFREAQALKRQEVLIAEEEEAEREQESRLQAKAAADKEKRAKKKEKKKAKKEAEKAKKEAEDEERRRLDDERRAEQERKAAEANERKRQEEAAALLLQQQQQLLQRQRIAEKAATSRQQEQARSSAAAPAAPVTSSSTAVPQPPTPKAVKAGPGPSAFSADSKRPGAQQSASSSSNSLAHATSNPTPSGRLSPSDSMQPSTRGLRSGSSSPTTASRANGSLTSSDSDISSDSASTDSTRAVPPFTGRGAAAAVAAAAASASGASTAHAAPYNPVQRVMMQQPQPPRSPDVPGVVPRHEAIEPALRNAAGPAAPVTMAAAPMAAAVSAAARRDPRDEEIITKLRARVRALEAQLLEKDGELYAMRDRLNTAQASAKEAQTRAEGQVRQEQQLRQEQATRYEQQLQQLREEHEHQLAQQQVAAAASAAAAAASAAAARQQPAAAAPAAARDVGGGRGTEPAAAAGSRHSLDRDAAAAVAADGNKGGSGGGASALANGNTPASHTPAPWAAPAAAAATAAATTPQSPRSHSSNAPTVMPLVGPTPAAGAREGSKDASASQAGALHSAGSGAMAARRNVNPHAMGSNATGAVINVAVPAHSQYPEPQLHHHQHQQHMARPHSSGGGSSTSSTRGSGGGIERTAGSGRLSMEAPASARSVPAGDHHGLVPQQPNAQHQGPAHQRSATHTGISGPQASPQQPPISSTAADMLGGGASSGGMSSAMLRANSAGLPSTTGMHGNDHGPGARSNAASGYAPQQQQNVRREGHGMNSKQTATPYLPPSSGGLSQMSQNGIAGVLHSSAPVQQQGQAQQGQQGSQQEGGLPSYRNAAAGVMGAGGPGAATNSSSASIGLPPGIGAVASAAQGVGGLGSAGSGSDVSAAGNGTGSSGHVAGAHGGNSHMSRASAHLQKRQQAADGNPFGGSLGMMQGPGVAQGRGLDFVQMQAKAAQQRSANHTMGHMENPGLDDFAHMNLIDDLLTE